MLPQELTGLTLFEGLRPEQLELLAPLFWRESFAADDTVFAEGDEALNVYVLQSGKVAIRFVPHDGGSLDIATIQAGGTFGWSAALGRSRYTSSAVCLSEVQTLVAKGSELRRVMHADPDLGASLLERMAEILASRFDGLRTQLVDLLGSTAGSDSLAQLPLLLAAPHEFFRAKRRRGA